MTTISKIQTEHTATIEALKGTERQLQRTLKLVIHSAKPEGLNKRQCLSDFGISEATFHRTLDEARHFGAKIDYDGIERVYRLSNADQCLKRARLWYRLETERYLTKT